MNRRKICLVIAIVLIASCLSACGVIQNQVRGIFQNQVDDEKLSIVTSTFTGYDFVRSIVSNSENVNIKPLLKPGSEAHSYEPTPQDIITIKNCDIFIFVGGESETWVNNILDSVDTSDIKVIAMMDLVENLTEEIVEGMEVNDYSDHDDDRFEPEYDEHVWTSPLNAIEIVNAISDAIILADPENKDVYTKNTEEYIAELNKLDSEFRAVVETGKRKTIVFGDRFPFRYFADEYGIKYFAAFPGCSSETEASAKTVSFLIDKVKNENIPVVFYPELSNKKVANTICESTGAKALQLNSCHNVTDIEFKNGATYLTLMSDNVEALREALN